MDPEMTNIPNDQIIFIKHKRTGKYLRGAKFWRWTSFWQLAWPTSRSVFLQRLNSGALRANGIHCLDDVIIVSTPDQLT